jgi:hypothetical protein
MLRHKRLIWNVVVALFAAAGVLGQGAQGNKPKITVHDHTKKAGGKLVMKYKPARGTIYPNVAELAKRSDMIVVGRIVGHKSNLTTDGRAITQDFMVKVQEVIKANGNLPKHTAVLVSLPGGTHRFPDKTYAAMVPIGFKTPDDGGTYVLFLKSRQPNSPYKGLRLVSENQGLFALKDGVVETGDLSTDDPVNVKYRKMAAPAFLREVHKAVPRKANNDK